MTDKKSRGRPEQGGRTDDLYPAAQRRSDGMAAHLPRTGDEKRSESEAPNDEPGSRSGKRIR